MTAAHLLRAAGVPLTPAEHDALLHVSVVAHARACRGHRRRVHAGWDPLLRRIELFDACDRSDADLVHRFLHEAAHATRADAGASPTAERAADGTADRWQRDLSATTVAALAAALRIRAAPPRVAV